MNQVEIKYDSQVDVLRLRFNDSLVEDSAEIQPGVIADYDQAGNMVGLEILDASLLIRKPDPASTLEGVSPSE